MFNRKQFVNYIAQFWDTGKGVSAPKLLDIYGGAQAAYSLRKLSSTYSGDAVRVRRSYDDGEADIGFDGNSLDETALLNHCVPSAIQAKYNDAMFFDGNNDAVLINTAFDWDGTWDISFSFILMDNSVANVNVIGANTDSGYGITYRPGENEWEVYIGGFSDGVNSVRSGLSHSVSIGVKYDMRFTFNGTNIQMRINGGSPTTRGLSAPVASSEPIAIGRRNTSNFDFRGVAYDIDIINNGSNFYASAGSGNTSGDWTNDYGGTGGSIAGGPAVFTGQDFNGFVTTWYDQSGATVRNATQTGATLQPSIFSNGSTVAVNGKPAINFDGSNDQLNYSAFSPDSIAIVSDSTTSGFEQLLGVSGSDFSFRKNNGSWGVDTLQDFPNSSALWINGALGTGSGAQELTFSVDTAWANNFNVISNGFLSRHWKGTAQEVIMFSGDKTSDRSGIEANINGHYGIY